MVKNQAGVFKDMFFAWFLQVVTLEFFLVSHPVYHPQPQNRFRILGIDPYSYRRL
jgi:hypothetical protein